jgi:hypothetical protein
MNHICDNPAHTTLNQCYKSFCGVQFPREDNTILHNDINDFKCDMVKMKVLLIRLRRRSDVKDWALFKFYFEQSWTEYINVMDSRWILSILETYADYADEPYRNNAMLATMPVTWERFAQTLVKSAWIVRDMPQTHSRGQTPIYDGLMTQQLQWADTPTNFFERTMKVLDSTPMIQTMYVELIKRMLDYNGSCLSKLIEVSEWPMKDSILQKLKR